MTLRLGAAPEVRQIERRRIAFPGMRISLRSVRPAVVAKPPKSLNRPA
jgi:hypothetical protein